MYFPKIHQRGQQYSVYHKDHYVSNHTGRNQVSHFHLFPTNSLKKWHQWSNTILIQSYSIKWKRQVIFKVQHHSRRKQMYHNQWTSFKSQSVNKEYLEFFFLKKWQVYTLKINMNYSWRIKRTSSLICVLARNLCNVGRSPANDSLRLFSCSPKTLTLRISTSSHRKSIFVSWISFGRSVSYKYVDLQDKLSLL